MLRAPESLRAGVSFHRVRRDETVLAVALPGPPWPRTHDCAGNSENPTAALKQEKLGRSKMPHIPPTPRVPCAARPRAHSRCPHMRARRARMRAARLHTHAPRAPRGHSWARATRAQAARPPVGARRDRTPRPPERAPHRTARARE